SSGTALDPADGVDAGQRLAVGPEHPPAVVREDEGALVEGKPGHRQRAVADGPQHEAARDGLYLPVAGPGTERSVPGSDDLVAAYVHGLYSTPTADLDRGAQEPQDDPPGSAGALGAGRELAEQRDVLAGGERSLALEPAL